MDARKQLYGLSANAFAELAHLLDVRILQILFREPPIGFNQAPGEIDRSIAHAAFHLIQHCPDLFPRESRMVEERQEGVNGLLKVNVVLPQRIIGI